MIATARVSLTWVGRARGGRIQMGCCIKRLDRRRGRGPQGTCLGLPIGGLLINATSRCFAALQGQQRRLRAHTKRVQHLINAVDCSLSITCAKGEGTGSGYLALRPCRPT